MSSWTSNSHFRRDRSLQRRVGKKISRPIILIVCEGETEKEYLEALKRKFRINNAQVLIANNTVGSSPTSVVQCALTKFAAVPTYDFVYCAFDRDDHQDYKKARDRILHLAARAAKPIPICEAISVPCIELWFLLHFKYSTAPHPDFNAIRPALRTVVPGYEKADAAIADALVGHVDRAIENAQRLCIAAEKDGFENPYTNFHLLVERIRGLATSPLL